MPRDFAPSVTDEIVRRYHERGGQPAIAYGIVRGGELVHAAGFGNRSLGGPVPGKTVPDERTVFRRRGATLAFAPMAVGDRRELLAEFRRHGREEFVGG